MQTLIPIQSVNINNAAALKSDTHIWFVTAAIKTRYIIRETNSLMFLVGFALSKIHFAHFSDTNEWRMENIVYWRIKGGFGDTWWIKANTTLHCVSPPWDLLGIKHHPCDLFCGAFITLSSDTYLFLRIIWLTDQVVPVGHLLMSNINKFPLEYLRCKALSDQQESKRNQIQIGPVKQN